MFKRSLVLPAPGTETFFLWGPRQTGKTTLLRQTYADARWVDLLKSEEFRRYVARPELLRQEVEAEPLEPGRQIVIDEIQKGGYAQLMCRLVGEPALEEGGERRGDHASPPSRSSSSCNWPARRAPILRRSPAGESRSRLFGDRHGILLGRIRPYPDF